MYHKKTHIHFIGIGGIGMSGIAHILKSQGYAISGCDVDLKQKSVHDLVALGCEIYEGNNSASCANKAIDIVVYSSAINDKNPEIIAAQKRGIPTIPRALMLAELMRRKYSIAIAGSHGKTTTTSLISHILIEAEQDPTVIIGGHLKSISSNARHGKGAYLVAESDESDRSFLHLYPTLAVVTNIDLEHLDIYKDIDDIKQTFKSFLSNIPFYGKAIICTDDKNIQSLLPITHVKTVSYGIELPAEWTAKNIQLEGDHSLFDLYHEIKQICRITITMPGTHNVLNALASIAITHELGIPIQDISTALATFKGVERRFTYKGLYKHAEFFDDYGHHPTEIDKTLLVARKRSQGKLIVIFEPHRYSRTEKLWSDFLAVFKQGDMDHLIITDIYSAGEQPLEDINSKKLVEDLQALHPKFSVTYAPQTADFSSIQALLEPLLEDNALVLTLGAGKITHFYNSLIK